MDKRKISTLLKIKKACQKSETKSKLLSEQSYACFNKCFDEDAHYLINYLRGASLAMRSVMNDHIRYQKIKDALVKSGLYKKSEIALELNEFLQMGRRAKVIIGPIDFAANIRKEDLLNIELLWSDASFTALNQSYYLKSLKYVMGNLTLGPLDYPLNLEFTGGDLDLLFTSDLTMLPHYQLAMGNIYLKEGQHLSSNVKVLGKVVIDSSLDKYINKEKVK